MTIQFEPREIKAYIPPVVDRVVKRILDSGHKKIGLVGFGVNFKWCYRELARLGFNDIHFFDSRKKFVGYDFAGSNVILIGDGEFSKCDVFVVVDDDIDVQKRLMLDIVRSTAPGTPVIYDISYQHRPFAHEAKYRNIWDRASRRASSMISEQQLFDLVQFVENTKDLTGDVVEYGTLYGGSAAVFFEAIGEFCPDKKLRVYDSFGGIPKAIYGVDSRWDDAFSDTSFSEVSDAFSGASNTAIIAGDILETYKQIDRPISIGYLASDTYATGEVLAPYIWKQLQAGGIMCVCDYGSYPNCVPLTAFIDDFVERIKSDAFVYKPMGSGIVIVKK
jgi:hypothetical protein